MKGACGRFKTINTEVAGGLWESGCGGCRKMPLVKSAATSFAYPIYAHYFLMKLLVITA